MRKFRVHEYHPQYHHLITHTVIAKDKVFRLSVPTTLGRKTLARSLTS